MMLAGMLLAPATLPAQVKTDSTRSKELKEVIIRAWQRRDITHMPEEQQGFLYSGKKNEVVNLAGTNANIAIKNGRQVFAKIPGVFVYDMDGSGNQVNIATRGLDPHRSWEYNIRQNGILVNSDMYGYPASHYSAPMESYEKIELTRGTGSLQYGAQFGGMINFVTKAPDSSRAFSFESINTVGSFNLLSSYNAVSGTHKKFSYYAYYYKRHSDGYRDNGSSDATAQLVQLQYRFSPRVNLKAELGRSKYLYQIPGPLNDSMFQADPTTSTRKRNYFSPDIYIPSLSLDWKLNSKTRAHLTLSGVLGDRNSVQFDAFAHVPDAIDPATGNYAHRQVDIDRFNSRTAELRVVHHYQLRGIVSTLATGLVYMNNDLHRRQMGKGSTGTDYDLSVTAEGFGRDIHFRTGNIALFAENKFQINPKWSVSPGIRYENGESKMSGVIKYYAPEDLPTVIPHRFLLAGISSQYQAGKELNFYGGLSTAYRPVIFKDIIPASTYERVDKNLEDASGYNAEVGARGKIAGNLQYDISLFRVLYKNRMGTLVLQDANGNGYTYKTNTGDSRTNGLEVFLQYKFPLAHQLFAGIFSSTSYMDARYTRGAVKGNRVEAVPEWISRNGLELLYQGFSATLQYSYTGSTYSDALNTVDPPPSGAKGFTPSYSLWDLNISARLNTHFTIRAGVNNLFDQQHFTKRPTFYPGPGIWPGDGRNLHMTVAVRI